MFVFALFNILVNIKSLLVKCGFLCFVVEVILQGCFLQKGYEQILYHL